MVKQQPAGNYQIWKNSNHKFQKTVQFTSKKGIDSLLDLRWNLSILAAVFIQKTSHSFTHKMNSNALFPKKRLEEAML